MKESNSLWVAVGSVALPLILATALLGCGADPSTDRGAGRSGNGSAPVGGTGLGAGGTASGGASSGFDAFGNPLQPKESGAGGGRPTKTGGGESCADAMVHTSTATPSIVFVIDGSGSMCETFGGATRWTALRTALLDPTNGLINRLQARVEFGMALYDGTIDLIAALAATAASPNPACAGMYATMKATGECPQLIKVMPAVLNNAAAIDAAFPQIELGGSTPTDKAMNNVMDELIAMQVNDPEMKMNPQFVILATDGQPNDICMGGAGGDGSAQKAAVIAAVDRGAAKGITTFVISLAGGDAALEQHLTEVAMHGNPMDPTAHTYSPMTPQDLVDALTALVGGAVGCDIFLNGKVAVGQECRGFVKVKGTALPCCQDKGGGAYTCDGVPAAPPNGWILKDPSTVELVGDACASFLKSPDAMLIAGFPCDVFVE